MTAFHPKEILEVINIRLLDKINSVKLPYRIVSAGITMEIISISLQSTYKLVSSPEVKSSSNIPS
jgi:hypothetical protein